MDKACSLLLTSVAYKALRQSIIDIVLDSSNVEASPITDTHLSPVADLLLPSDDNTEGLKLLFWFLPVLQEGSTIRHLVRQHSGASNDCLIAKVVVPQWSFINRLQAAHRQRAYQMPAHCYCANLHALTAWPVRQQV